MSTAPVFLEVKQHYIFKCGKCGFTQEFIVPDEKHYIILSFFEASKRKSMLKRFAAKHVFTGCIK